MGSVAFGFAHVLGSLLVVGVGLGAGSGSGVVVSVLLGLVGEGRGCE